jgi:hypothetical protein
MTRQEVMQAQAKSARSRGEWFFYVRIPAALEPEERISRYETRLHRELAERYAVGMVTGGGSQLGDAGQITFCGVDVVVSDRELGLAALRKTLLQIGAPVNTIIEEYTPDLTELTLL